MSLASASSPVMVGREPEFDALWRALEDGRAGRPRLAVVRGEAGIGKTRLVEELRAAARATRPRSGPVLVEAIGQCVDLGAMSSPFAPIRRMLRDLLSAVGPEQFARAVPVPSHRRALATLVPALGNPGQPDAEDAPQLVTEAIEGLVENLSIEHHLLLVLEDLHWADAATLALVRTLATTLRGSHVTMVVTYRSDDVDRFHPLRPVVAEFERNRAIVGIELERLSAEQAADQAARIRAPGPGLSIDEIAQRSGGIPFLVEELVAVGCGPLPETLHDLVVARYERLSAPARQLVREVAAGGTEVNHDLLLRVSSLAPDDVDVALREAIEARVLMADGDGYSFRHALTQEALHGDLLASERIRLHGRYAQALEDRSGDGRPSCASEIAHHWRLAREPRRALAAASVAIDEAECEGATASIPELVDAISELWPLVPDAEQVAGCTLPFFLARGVRAYLRLANYHRGRRAAEEALALCPETHRHTRAELLWLLFVLQVNSTGTSSAGDPALLDQARALLEGSDRPSSRALLARVHATRAVLGLADDPLALTSQAVALAREWGTDDDLAYCLRQRAEVMAADGDLLGCLETLALGRDLAMHPSTRFYFLTTEMSVDNVLGRYTEAIRVGERALAATRSSAGERVQASFVGANLIESYLLAGSPQAALDLAPRVVAQLPQRGWRAFVAWTLAGHHSWNDEDDLAADQFAAAGDGPPDDEAKTVLARVTAEHRLAEARDAATPQQRAASIEAALAGLAPAAAAPRPREFFQLGPLVPVIARALAAAAESGTPVDPSLRERLAELRRDAPELPIARVWEALAAAELAEPAAQPAAWRAAVDVLETTGPARYLHYARYRWAEALVAAGERDAAAAPLRLVASQAPGQGAGRVARWAAELAARAGVPLTAHPPQATGRGAVTGIDALTSRELQVLELVAEGLTNPQIGQRLFISPKTASVHVSAILAKIGATSRTEAAARFAGRSGRTAAGELADRSS